jgi:hypothetical protein
MRLADAEHANVRRRHAPRLGALAVRLAVAREFPVREVGNRTAHVRHRSGIDLARNDRSLQLHCAHFWRSFRLVV